MFRFILVFCSVITLSLNAALLPKELKHIHNILNNKFQDLSPLPGLVWYKGGVLENLAELSIEKNTTIKLIREFFHRDNPLTFRETRAANNIVSYLDPYKIGQIMGSLKLFKIELEHNPKYCRKAQILKA
jgi:hypothetical protein